jgi:hypothetical protein
MMDVPVNFNMDQVWNAFFNVFAKIATALTGGNVNVTYGITAVIFFILIFAIVLQIIRAIKLFGQESNKLQNTIAFALAALSTIAVFWYTKGDLVTILRNILAPFGIWVGLIVGGVMGLITYRGIQESGVFPQGSNQMIVFGIASSVGLMFASMLFFPNVMWIGILILIVSIILAISTQWRTAGNIWSEGGVGGARQAGQELQTMYLLRTLHNQLTDDLRHFPATGQHTIPAGRSREANAIQTHIGRLLAVVRGAPGTSPEEQREARIINLIRIRAQRLLVDVHRATTPPGVTHNQLQGYVHQVIRDLRVEERRHPPVTTTP